MVAGVKSVAGEVRDAAAATSSSASTGAKTVAGQAKAQGARVAKVADRQANHVVDETRVSSADRPAPGTPYEQWTKAQLMDRAREVDVDGRATMNKVRAGRRTAVANRLSRHPQGYRAPMLSMLADGIYIGGGVILLLVIVIVVVLLLRR